MSNGVIQVTSDAVQTLESNTSAIKFTNVTLITNSANCFNGWLNHNEGSGTFNIVMGGLYEIGFSANVTSATAGIVGLGIYADGVKLNGTEMDEVITAVGDYHNVSTSKLVRVCGRGSVTITINSVPAIVFDGTSTDTEIPIVKNANIYIKKLA